MTRIRHRKRNRKRLEEAAKRATVYVNRDGRGKVIAAK